MLVIWSGRVALLPSWTVPKSRVTGESVSGEGEAMPKRLMKSSALLASAKAHATQELESYPLDSMTMVGSLQQGGKAHALLMVESRLHDVKVGDWIGQNYGQITSITDSQITLRETVQDPTGEWIERTSTLQIQEKAR